MQLKAGDGHLGQPECVFVFFHSDIWFRSTPSLVLLLMS